MLVVLAMTIIVVLVVIVPPTLVVLISSSNNCSIISTYNTVTEDGRHCTYDVTMRYVRATILTMGER